MRRAVVLNSLALVVGSAVLLAGAAVGQVRVPRDSPIVIHGRVQQPRSADPSRVAPPPTPSLSVIRRSAPPPSIGIDPGYRPL